MLFRKSQVIQEYEIKKAIHPQTPRPSTENQLEATTEQLAEKLLSQILDNQGNFWSVVYQPYSKQEITREVVLKLVEKARAEGATNMPKLARLFAACNPDNPSEEEKRSFFRFKNFLYKTVRIQ